jgi:hypothetical protein
MSTPQAAARHHHVDPELLVDLRLVNSARRMFSACGERVQPWEAFTLVKAAREELQAEIERVQGWIQTGMRALLSPVLKERLAGISAEFGTLAGQLIGFLQTSENCPLEPDHIDFAVVFLMGSANARRSVTRWVSDPAGSAADSSLKLRILSTLVQSCLYALDHPESQPALPEDTSRRVRGAAIRLRPDAVAALRVLDRCGALLKQSGVEAGWELYYLALTRADETRLTLEELEQLQTGGKPGEFAGAAQRLRSPLKEVRADHQTLIPPLRAYLTGAFGSFDSERDDLALALLAGSPQGRHFARQWLEDPALCHDAAVASMTAMRGRASSYFDTARKPAAGPEPQPVA